MGFARAICLVAMGWEEEVKFAFTCSEQACIRREPRPFDLDAGSRARTMVPSHTMMFDYQIRSYPAPQEDARDRSHGDGIVDGARGTR